MFRKVQVISTHEQRARTKKRQRHRRQICSNNVLICVCGCAFDLICTATYRCGGSGCQSRRIARSISSNRSRSKEATNPSLYYMRCKRARECEQLRTLLRANEDSSQCSAVQRESQPTNRILHPFSASRRRLLFCVFRALHALKAYYMRVLWTMVLRYRARDTDLKSAVKTTPRIFVFYSCFERAIPIQYPHTTHIRRGLHTSSNIATTGLRDSHLPGQVLMNLMNVRRLLLCVCVQCTFQIHTYTHTIKGRTHEGKIMRAGRDLGRTRDCAQTINIRHTHAGCACGVRVCVRSIELFYADVVVVGRALRRRRRSDWPINPTLIHGTIISWREFRGSSSADSGRQRQQQHICRRLLYRCATHTTH